MRQLNLQHLALTEFNNQTVDGLPRHGTGTKNPACNDESFLQEESVINMTLSVLANVVGGALLLIAMFNLPIIFAVIWDL